MPEYKYSCVTCDVCHKILRVKRNNTLKEGGNVYTYKWFSLGIKGYKEDDDLDYWSNRSRPPREWKYEQNAIERNILLCHECKEKIVKVWLDAKDKVNLLLKPHEDTSSQDEHNSLHLLELHNKEEDRQKKRAKAKAEAEEERIKKENKKKSKLVRLVRSFSRHTDSMLVLIAIGCVLFLASDLF